MVDWGTLIYSQSGYQTKSKFVIHAKLNHSLLRDVYYGGKNYL
jgi:hypothetical protein